MCATTKCAAALDPVSAIPFDLGWERNALSAHWLQPLDALIITKCCAGFDKGVVEELRNLLTTIARGGVIGLKYLVFDFAHPAENGIAEGAEGFEELVAANAELILDAPVISIAWARSLMAGADLDFALYCSAMVAETPARFSFEGDPNALFGLYAALARRIGFVKAERLIDRGDALSATEMLDLCLVKEVVEPEDGFSAFEHYIARCGRRYNASYAVFRAQRIAMPPMRRKS
jgi:enoyl-CoA hydratase/carnithine racemase